MYFWQYFFGNLQSDLTRNNPYSIYARIIFYPPTGYGSYTRAVKRQIRNKVHIIDILHIIDLRILWSPVQACSYPALYPGTQVDTTWNSTWRWNFPTGFYRWPARWRWQWQECSCLTDYQHLALHNETATSWRLREMALWCLHDLASATITQTHHMLCLPCTVIPICNSRNGGSSTTNSISARKTVAMAAIVIEYYYTVSQKQRPPFYFSNNPLKN